MTYDENTWRNRWKNFRPVEIYSPAALDRYRHKLCPYSMDNLQLWREMLGEVLLCNHQWLTLRGVRTNEDNHTAGGAQESMHVTGRAFDISSPAIDTKDLYIAATTCGLWGGVGLYDTFVHVDTRLVNSDTPTTWDRRTNIV